jgi:hypothetical protein
VILRHLIAMVAAVTATAALAPSAHAWTTRFSFSSQEGAPGLVAVDSPYSDTRLELVRNGVVIGHGFTDALEVSALQHDDVAKLYQGSGNTLIASATYEATPTINGTACIGRNAFNVTKAADAVVIDAGAFAPAAGGYRSLRSVWTTGNSFTVSLERTLQSGDVAYAETSVLLGDVEVRTFRGVAVLACAFEPRPELEPPVAPPPPAPPAPSPTTPTDGQMVQAVKGSVGASVSGLRPLRLARLAKRQSVLLPFAFPEPGAVKLDLVAKGQTVGTGTRTSAANGKFDVSIKLTDTGRKLFKRTKKKLKVTLKGSFTPARSGQSALTAGVTVTLKR